MPQPLRTPPVNTQDTEPVAAHRLSPQAWAVPGSPARIPQGTRAPAAAQPGAVHSGSAALAEPCRLLQSSVLPGQAAPGASTLGRDGGADGGVPPALEPSESPTCDFTWFLPVVPGGATACTALLDSQPLAILAPREVHAPSAGAGAATRHEVRGLVQASGVPTHLPSLPPFF